MGRYKIGPLGKGEGRREGERSRTRIPQLISNKAKKLTFTDNKKKSFSLTLEH